MASNVDPKVPIPNIDDTPVTCKQKILQIVAKSEGFFKSQQRGDPDLTYEDKYGIAQKLLEEKPAIFLSRYGKFLSQEEMLYFEPMQGDYLVDFHLEELKVMSDDKKNKTKVRNRRFEAMKEMMEKGSYFSDEETKKRDPLLYEQMVGQYLNEDEVNDMVDRSDLRLSTILFKHMDVVESNIIYGLQKEIEDGQMEEEDDDSEDDDEAEEDMDDDDEAKDKKPQISEEDKRMLRAEFLRTMQLRFLDGDPDFDYSDIDGNVAYDSLEIRERDEQEKYFDQEDDDKDGISSKSSSIGDLTFLTPSEFKRQKSANNDHPVLGENKTKTPDNGPEKISGKSISININSNCFNGKSGDES